MVGWFELAETLADLNYTIDLVPSTTILLELSWPVEENEQVSTH